MCTQVVIDLTAILLALNQLDIHKCFLMRCSFTPYYLALYILYCDKRK